MIWYFSIRFCFLAYFGGACPTDEHLTPPHHISVSTIRPDNKLSLSFLASKFTEKCWLCNSQNIERNILEILIFIMQFGAVVIGIFYYFG